MQALASSGEELKLPKSQELAFAVFYCAHYKVEEIKEQQVK
jgi:hypothetical protein